VGVKQTRTRQEVERGGGPTRHPCVAVVACGSFVRRNQMTIEELRRHSPELALATPRRKPVEEPSTLTLRLRLADG
jgi:hypothetical protein